MNRSSPANYLKPCRPSAFWLKMRIACRPKSLPMPWTRVRTPDPEGRPANRSLSAIEPVLANPRGMGKIVRYRESRRNRTTGVCAARWQDVAVFWSVSPIDCHEKGQRPFQPIFPLLQKTRLTNWLDSTFLSGLRSTKPSSPCV